MWDHPRSRGVYPRLTVAVSARWGSSPLARGLRLHGDPEQGPLRIIPARAGFTTRTSRRRRTWTDHPRSRGVYASRTICASEHRGSSPLARGLQRPRIRPYLLERIIPARAGFTFYSFRRWTFGADHPRSRGVYAPPRGWSRAGVGSSPLARGLPDHPRCRLPVPGIIPARAGFTPMTLRS